MERGNADNEVTEGIKDPRVVSTVETMDVTGGVAIKTFLDWAFKFDIKGLYRAYVVILLQYSELPHY